MTGVYLIHLSRRLGNLDNPHGTAQHYMGWSSDIAARLRAHKKGHGAKMMAAVTECGIAWECVRRWKGATRADERKLKNRKNASRLCPICQKARASHDGG